MPHHIQLNEIDDQALNTIGGKALNLGRLIQAGFTVPEGIVIPTDTYYAHIQKKSITTHLQDILNTLDYSNENEIEHASRRIKELITKSPLLPGLKKEIEESLHTLSPTTTWAVRSSATAEDLPEASFAGQQDTYLNIITKEVGNYIKSCWASYWNSRAISYRHNNNISHLQGGVAVVIQRMINAEKSGVIFTNDPRNKRADTIILESIYGLGEAIVSGLVTPDQFAIDKNTGKIIKQNINKQELKITLTTSGTINEQVPKKQQEEPSLTPSEITQLTTLGTQIEDHFQSPQDIEWSIENKTIYLLQSRPITTIEENNEILWTRGYGDEYWTDVASPLYVSLLGHYLETYLTKEGAAIMGYKEVLGHDLIRIHKAHAYFNCDVLEQVFTYYPKFARTKELLNYFPITEQERIKNFPTKTLKLLASQLRIAFLDPDGRMGKTNDAYIKWTKEFLEKMEPFDKADLTTFSYPQLQQTFFDMEQAYLKHYRLIRYGMVSHSIATNLMVKKWLENWLGDTQGILYSKIISGLSGNKTVETNIAIAKLAQHAQKYPSIMKSLTNDTPEEFLKKLEKNRTWKPFKDSFSYFLNEYGHRSHTREVYFPCWVDDPTLIVTILQSLITNDNLDFSEIEQQKRKERIQTEQEILTRIEHQRFGLIKKLLFKIVLNYAQIYLTFRENQRFYLDHQHLRQRRLFMEYGRRFHNEQRIDDPMDIFFLSKEDIFAIASGEKTINKEQLLAEKEEFHRNQGRLPPKFIKGKIEFEDTVIHDQNSLKITGVGCSPGVTKGTIRVIKNVNQLSQLKDHDILVTRNTDPAWTPVFKKLSGLITETGGILSHGAVVSREYGIPAVTAVKGATDIFKNGQTVTIDGNDGIIYLEEDTS